MKVGERVKVSPDLTGLDAWYEGIIVDIENNRLNRNDISIKLHEARIIYGQQRFFQSLKKK